MTVNQLIQALQEFDFRAEVNIDVANQLLDSYSIDQIYSTENGEVIIKIRKWGE